jgi:hypothetical protein
MRSHRNWVIVVGQSLDFEGDSWWRPLGSRQILQQAIEAIFSTNPAQTLADIRSA